MPDQIAEEIKAERSEELIRIAAELSHAYREKFLGRRLEILSEEEFESGGRRYALGHTREYVKCIKECGTFRHNVLMDGTAKEIFNEKAMDEYIVLV